MVKVSGVSTSNVPGGFISLPGATYVADSKLLGIAIFLEGDFSAKVLLKTSEQRPIRIDFEEFSRIVDHFTTFSRGELADSDPVDFGELTVGIVLLESNRVMIHFGDSRITLVPLDFMLALNVLQATRKKLEKMIARRNERRALLRQDDLLEKLKNWWGLLVFAILALLDLYFLVGIFFRPHLFKSFIVLTIVLAFWLLVLRPEWADRAGPALYGYFNENFLSDLAGLKSSQKTVWAAILLVLLVAFYIYFGWEFFSIIVSFFKGNRSV